ncbi:MAG: efflux RND transporter permease subunit [Coxiellaceae bacterium]|jgi:multidrug efflux pump|nr:efflux RND transporter permease subunit [Coxiellaceae bacterium]
MSFTDIFIRRPVFATVLSLIILLVGLRCYFDLPVREYPRIDASVVSVTVTYAGADAALMEGFVTTPIENALGGVDGVDYITSSSATGRSNITVYFNLGYDINAAISDINAKVNSVRYLLPNDIDSPVIAKNDPNARPSIYLSFSSSVLSVEAISDYLTRLVQPQLQTLPGVGSAQIWAPIYAMRIWLDHKSMAAHNITPADIDRVFMTQNLQAPGGVLKTSLQALTVKTFSEANTAEQFNNLVIRQDNGQLVKIKDVGRAELGSKTSDVSVWINGKVGAILAITPSSIANPIDIATEVKKIFPSLIAALPKTINTKIMWDSSKFILESIKEVKKTIVEATLCVILVVFLFLGSWRTLIIPVVTIPLSLVGVCIIMYCLGYSLNTITFLSMVLAIGMVVDDAIVVTENIHRHIAQGKTAFEASMLGAREIQFAIISMTLTLAAVYAPIGFLTGLIGQLFKEFAFTLAGSVIISGFIALTLSPMMCSKIMLPYGTVETGFAKKTHDFFEKVMKHYEFWLQKTLNNRNKVLSIIPIVLITTGALYYFIPSELAPSEDQGYLFSPIMAPASANINYMHKYSKVIESYFAKVPETEGYLVVNGVGSGSRSPHLGISVLILKPWAERKRNVDQIIAELFPKLYTIPGVLAFPINPSGLPGAGSGDPIKIELQTYGDYEKLNEIAQKVSAIAQKNPHLYNLRVEPKLDQPQFGIHVNREKAGALGISMGDIGSAINLILGQPVKGHFSIEGHSYDVVPQLFPELSKDPRVMDNIYLRTASNTLVPLRNVVTFDETVMPESYNHFQKLRSMEITASTTQGYTLGQALNFFKDTIKSVIPDDIKIDYSGQSRLYFQTGGQMELTFIFAVIFIFLVLAAQFESFRDPLIILFTIPLSMFGALLVMLVTRGTLNIYSEIGLVTLVGLISKHGILVVEFANQLQETGKSIKEAIIASAVIRLRPILMTTAAMVLGAVPLAIATGAGAASRHQIGWVIIGGMLIGTMFTLFVVPTVYTYIASKKSVCEIKEEIRR